LSGRNESGNTIGENCLLGSHIRIFADATINDGVVIAAEAEVWGTTPANKVSGKVLAWFIRNRD
jgi:acetyltransferase-like isoleucine patch superfamily enzyme